MPVQLMITPIMPAWIRTMPASTAQALGEAVAFVNETSSFFCKDLLPIMNRKSHGTVNEFL